ncbi:hypothetical protein EV356DRAFT_516079 [Viridothelium virens]|uniref:Transmembrane protein n=1 Tax=Viridothelium virens TaxID=1048519 RepID=A0A6A6H6Q6_VIRVR|nr:hypothetical protein EV356DRAFT_516079 [Viridothelium virens]
MSLVNLDHFPFARRSERHFWVLQLSTGLIVGLRLFFLALCLGFVAVSLHYERKLSRGPVETRPPSPPSPPYSPVGHTFLPKKLRHRYSQLPFRGPFSAATRIRWDEPSRRPPESPPRSPKSGSPERRPSGQRQGSQGGFAAFMTGVKPQQPSGQKPQYTTARPGDNSRKSRAQSNARSRRQSGCLW